ncbi:hypothetical protein AGMMS49990_04090 [Endomicrobiia bacterium]|nr:hypothetical protein AGMMS49990_04090 [Endomicrobiia bacterium]
MASFRSADANAANTAAKAAIAASHATAFAKYIIAEVINCNRSEYAHLDAAKAALADAAHAAANAAAAAKDAAKDAAEDADRITANAAANDDPDAKTNVVAHADFARAVAARANQANIALNAANELVGKVEGLNIIFLNNWQNQRT